MDRVKIKETSKNLLKKNHWLCVGVGFIITFVNSFKNIDLTRKTDYSSLFERGFNLSNLGEIIENFYEDILIAPEGSFQYFLLYVTGLVLSVLITVFVGNQVLVGARRFFLKYRKNQPVDIGELFQSYKDKTFLNVAKVTFIKDVYIFLWSCLCVIPGIIKLYEYAAVEYILAVNPTIEHSRAIDLSKKIMNGHKLELFELRISFIGWHILSLFTCGILSICYVYPYLLIAEAEFFAGVRQLAIYNGTISFNDIPDYEEYNPQPQFFTNPAPDGNSYYAPTTNNGYAPNTYTNAPYTPAQPTEQPVVSSIPEPTTPQTTESPVDTATNTQNAPQEETHETTDASGEDNIE